MHINYDNINTGQNTARGTILTKKEESTAKLHMAHKQAVKFYNTEMHIGQLHRDEGRENAQQNFMRIPLQTLDLTYTPIMEKTLKNKHVIQENAQQKEQNT